MLDPKLLNSGESVFHWINRPNYPFSVHLQTIKAKISFDHADPTTFFKHTSNAPQPLNMLQFYI